MYLKMVQKFPMVIVTESIKNNIVVVAARTYPKYPADYTHDEKEDASLDIKSASDTGRVRGSHYVQSCCELQGC